MDLKEQQISDSSSPSSQTKSCSDCHTTKTPLWRGGPSGPKSLCNACGIKYNKKRRALLGLNTGNKDKKKIGVMKQQKNSSIGSGEVGRSLKLRLVTMGGRGDMVLQKISSSSSSSAAAAAAAANQQQKEQQMRSKKFGEEEQAAVLLMALSCGSFY